MSEILKSEYLTLAEVRELLENEREKRAEAERELTHELKMALDHANTFSKTAGETAKKLVESLMDVQRIKDSRDAKFLSHKIADLMPSHPDDVRLIFSKERFALSSEEIDQILDLVDQHFEE